MEGGESSGPRWRLPAQSVENLCFASISVGFLDSDMGNLLRDEL